MEHWHGAIIQGLSKESQRIFGLVRDRGVDGPGTKILDFGGTRIEDSDFGGFFFVVCLSLYVCFVMFLDC